MNVDRAAEIGITVDPQSLGGMPGASETDPLEARWIVAEFRKTSASVNESLSNYRYDDAANKIYQFFWGSFCDWYLEIVKLRLDFSETADETVRAGTKAALTIFMQVFEASLRLLSPFMPFLTEEVWHAIYDGNPPARSIALCSYPTQSNDEPKLQSGSPNYDPHLLGSMQHMQSLISDLRNERKERGVPERETAPIEVYSRYDWVRSAFSENLDVIGRLARISAIKFSDTELMGPSVIRHLDVYEAKLNYEASIDVPAERDRLTKEITKLQKEIIGNESKLGNEAFLAKAPPAIVDGLKKQQDEKQQFLVKAKTALDALPPA